MLNNSGDSLSSDWVLCFSNCIARSFITKLKNIVLKISPFLSHIDVPNGVETQLVEDNETLVELYIEVIVSKNLSLIPNCCSLCFKISCLIESYAFWKPTKQVYKYFPFFYIFIYQTE